MNKNCKGNNTYEESNQQIKEDLGILKKVLKESREQCKEIEHFLKLKRSN